MRKSTKIALAAVLLPILVMGALFAQSAKWPGPLTGIADPNGNQVGQANPLSVSTTQLAYEGTLVVSASSAPISGLTLNFGTFPTGYLGTLFILNSGSNAVNICFNGGTCSATGGSFALPSGAAIEQNLGSLTTVPTVFSTSGTTLTISN